MVTLTRNLDWRKDAIMFGESLSDSQIVIFVLIVLGCIAAIWSQIFHKAGYSRSYGLLFLIPLVNLLTIVWFGFTKWPVEIERERLRGAQSPTRDTAALP